MNYGEATYERNIALYYKYKNSNKLYFFLKSIFKEG